MMTQAQLWAAAAALAVISAVAALAERARGKRRNLDKPGWVPWTLLQLLAMTLAVVLIALAILKRG